MALPATQLRQMEYELARRIKAQTPVTGISSQLRATVSPGVVGGSPFSLLAPLVGLLPGIVGGGVLGTALGGLAGWGLSQLGGGNGGSTALTARGSGGGGFGPMTQYGIRGPGVPEPAPGTVMKQWSVAVNSNTYGTFRIYYFRMFDGYTLMYNPSTETWKRWRPKKPLAVMYRGKTTLAQAVKVQKYLDKMWRTVARKTKALKLA